MKFSRVMTPLRRVDPATATPGGSGRYRVSIADTLAAVPAATWDAVVAGGALTRSHAYLSAVAAAAQDDCRFQFVLVRIRIRRIVFCSRLFGCFFQFLGLASRFFRSLFRFFQGGLLFGLFQCRFL